MAIKPPDVPEFVDRYNGYATGSNPTILGDGSDLRGGVPPVYGRSPLPYDIPSTAPGWLTTYDPMKELYPGWEDKNSFNPDSDTYGSEAKFRTIANPSHLAPDDPIIAYNDPGEAHWHQFFGNTATNAWTTHTSTRNRANENAERYLNGKSPRAASTAAGGPFNATNYWHPAFMLNDGSDKYAITPSRYIIYYAGNPAFRSLQFTDIPTGLRYIGGVNMFDPDGTLWNGRKDAANALASPSNRYGNIGDGWNGYTMFEGHTEKVIPTTTGENSSRCLVNPDGSDPWGGMATEGRCRFAVNLPEGWDGYNLWSPDGFSHICYPCNDTEDIFSAVPQGWFKLPKVEITGWLYHHGWEDYRRWYLSSDAHANMVAGRNLGAGASFHLDWFDGWDETIRLSWLHECLGTTGNPRECDSSTAGPSLGLLGGAGSANAPDNSRSPQIDMNTVIDARDLSQLVKLPTSTKGPITSRLVA